MSGDLRADIVARQGTFTLDLLVTLEASRVLAVVGPNGAGKSTLLRCLAGLRHIDEGTITVDEVTWDNAATRDFTTPAHRSVGVLFQDYRLFPTMSALENVAFGLRARRMAKREAEAVARDWLERVGVASRAQARPDALSGGQAQRVALARALAPQPTVLLLDEPFAALDAQGRLELRTDLSDILDAFSGQAVVVTHDPNDALALADELLVLSGGRAVDRGPMAEVIRRPRSPFIARLLSLNLVAGQVRDGQAQLGPFRLRAPGVPDGPVLGCCQPEDVQVLDSAAEEAAPATVTHLVRQRHGARVSLAPHRDGSGDGDETGLISDIAAAPENAPRPGSSVWIHIPQHSWDVYPAQPGEADS
ncbi:sulfate/molybdate ABC transporter ATP-binding protein [Propionibacterium sp.]|uniref:sulfate/molybdate ABC transporter ATP-binding protein n=1 Tax=Propionibacterium sp. TaxID=1977903 RepID=UPI0039EB7278